MYVGRAVFGQLSHPFCCQEELVIMSYKVSKLPISTVVLNTASNLTLYPFFASSFVKRILFFFKLGTLWSPLPLSTTV